MYDKAKSLVRRPQLCGGPGEGKDVGEGTGRRQAGASSSGKLCFNVQEFWEFSQAAGLPQGSSLTFVSLVSFGYEIPA